MKKKFCKILSLCFFMLVVVQVQAGYCKSLSINEAVNMALQNNLDIKIAGKKEVQAQAELAGIKAQRGVTVSLKSDFSVAGGKTDGIKKEFERDNSNSISVTYPVYSGGKDSLNIAIQQQIVQQSQLNTLRTAENIKYDTLKAYYDVLEAKKTIAVDDESVNNYEKHLINVKQLYSAGSVPKSDLLRSEVELSNARQTLITAKNTYDVDVITLKNIIKMDRNEPLELTEDFKYEGFNKPLANCLSFALDHRKDLEESKIDYIVAQKNIELAKADYKPTVTASLSSGWNNQPLPGGNDHDYTAGVSASWNVFDNGVTKANINAAEAEMEQAQLTLQQKNDDI
ncbi:TolC family protein [Pectinatus brassicae]|uniref:Outer membrane protein TolC n=1 Tax=Pectinatus brassicae TaxID=862415 RepID=A0A840UTT8_9FIRM|nr:TolC family protein [Pectinatus brassicae]MBB5337542.1 outer membrane protein TolC [Pectinatus brassicae]